jgi:ATP-dependent DNA helicase RecG
MPDWSREDVTTLNGVGPKLKEKLARLGIHNKQQLLFHLPLRYEDRTRLTPLGSLQPGQSAVIEAEVLQSGVAYRRRRNFIARLHDGTGFMDLRLFHFNAGQATALREGNRVRCFGEVRRIMGSMEMIHPEFLVVDPDNPPPLDEFLTPIYPTTDGLHQLGLRKIMNALMSELVQRGLTETMPAAWLEQHGFPPLSDALHVLHNPRNQRDVALIQQTRHPAQFRFIVEELAAHRISLMQRRKRLRERLCPRVDNDGDLQTRMQQGLPFSLTAAQQRVLDDINADFSSNKPMMRLLQGDVGCGKTVVAALAALPVIASGYQCALMAPTEILAEQHLRNLGQWFAPLNIEVISLMGSDKGRKRKDKEALIASGAVSMIVGTHALFQASVEFDHLGLIIIDEQHRFGVEQRQALHNKSRADHMPHQLIMTATPIPRTLARSIYADLDYSQIDELPPGRKPVRTSIVSNNKRGELIESVRRACADGQQVYWVCTLVEESEAMQCEAAENTWQTLREQLPEINVGLVHGRMKSAEKDAAVQAFKAGDVQLLVATTVIEVGVDAPNASIIIIENPERLGLSQIHQLRGRVGRGERESFCILLVKSDLSAHSAQRLEVIRNHANGFEIAEKDLELRGAGEVLGTRQTGEASFRIANLVRDARWFDDASELAELLMPAAAAERRQQLLDNWVGDRSGFSDIG